MTDITLFRFTNKADKAKSRDGWFLGLGQKANALAGNDVIIGTREAGEGIENTGRLLAGFGNDLISGISRQTTSGNGIYNAYGGLISGGPGNDTIQGQSQRFGINNDANSTISGDDGNDRLIGLADYGITNAEAGQITMGAGRDSLQGKGGVIGLSNNGVITTDAGKDTVIASGREAAILNNGLIDTGSDNDVVDGLTGGFSGTGRIQLGDGDDVLTGFGTGQFFGDLGQDSLLLPTGTYSIDTALGTISSGETAMQVTGFELVGGFNGNRFNMASGTLIVDSQGQASFS